MKGNKLTGGDAAPQFNVTDALGKAVDLTAYKNKHVLLAFLRYSGCPFCNLTIHRLSLEYPMLSDSGCEVIAFVQSSGTNIKRNIYERHQVKPPFPIIPDPKRTIYDMYDVQPSVLGAARSVKDVPHWITSIYKHGYEQPEIDGNLFLVPALFLVGPDKQWIVKAEYGTSFYDHRTFTDIYEPLVFK